MFKTFFQLFHKFQKRIYGDRLFSLQLVAIIICLDFLSFIMLASIDVTYFLNPFHFLSSPPVDERVPLKMFYPPTFSLKKKDQQGNSRGLISINQKVYQQNFSNKIKLSTKEKLLKNIELLIHELTIGVNDIRVKRAIKNKHLIQKVWIYNENLIIHLNKKLWSKLSVNEKTLIKDSLFLSITENFAKIKDIIWTL